MASCDTSATRLRILVAALMTAVLVPACGSDASRTSATIDATESTKPERTDATTDATTAAASTEPVAVPTLPVTTSAAPVDTSSPLDASAARAGLQRVIDGIEFDEDGTGEIGICPFGIPDPFVDLLPESIEQSPEYLADRGGSTSAFHADDLTGVTCRAEPDDPDEVPSGLRSVTFGAFFDPPGGFAAFITDNIDPSAPPDFSPDITYGGGTIISYCQTRDDGSRGCGAAWVGTDADLVVLLSLVDDDLEVAQVVESLQIVLPGLLTGLSTAGAPDSTETVPTEPAVTEPAITGATFAIDDSSPTDPPLTYVAAAQEELAAFLERRTFNASDIDVLDGCPFGLVNPLLFSIFGEDDASSFRDIVDRVRLTGEGRRVAECQAFTDEPGPNGVTYVQFGALVDVPDDFSTSDVPDIDPLAQAPSFYDSRGFDGGEVVSYCTYQAGVQFSCAAVWIAPARNLALSLEVTSRRVAVEDVITDLELVLPEMASRLSVNAARVG